MEGVFYYLENCLNKNVFKAQSTYILYICTHTLTSIDPPMESIHFPIHKRELKRRKWNKRHSQTHTLSRTKKRKKEENEIVA